MLYDTFSGRGLSNKCVVNSGGKDAHLICQAMLPLNNRLGLHMRAAAELVKTASKYHCQIRVACGPHIANGKSLLALLALGVSCGMNVSLIADGDDALQALDAIKQLIENRFSYIGRF